MHLALRTVLAVGLIALFAGPCAAETPLQAIKRGLEEPLDYISRQLKAPRKPRAKATAAATVPLLSAPMPRLRPRVASVVAAPVLGYAAPPVVAEPLIAMPEPRLRPPPAGQAAISALASGAPKASVVAPPSEPSSAPETKLASLPPEPLPDLVAPPPAAQSTCGVAIASLGVISTPLAPIVEGECGVTAPVAVASLDGGAVDFSGKAIVECDLAERLGNWVRKDVEPAVRRTYKEELTGLRIADSYSCRTRDNIPDAQLSEHAHGNAIDISAFRVGKRWIEVGPGWRGGGDDLAFLTEIRKSACGPFTTVLGPGSDSYHAEHFHLDIIRRGKNGRNLYCH